MIAKCVFIALLAVAVRGDLLIRSGCNSQSSPVATVSSGCSSGSSGATSVTRNLVGKGKYPVALNNCGPSPSQQIPVTTSRVTAPVQERPTVRLPAKIPAPKTICHTCTCYKTILRPRVQQQIITVPTVQRYIETTHKPVIENIQYEAVPVNCDNSGSSSCGSVQVVEVGSGSSSSSSSGSVELISSGSSCGSQVQAIEVPTQQVQVVETPRVQVVEIPRVQAVEIPRVQAVEVPRVQVVEVPRVQVVEAPRVQTIQIPQTVSVGSSCNCL